ncbi:MAG: hypothetical protein AAF437_15095 [Pseudomonadota bacterium]
MKQFAISALAFGLVFSANAEDNSRDTELVKSLNQADVRFVVESLDHTVKSDLDETIGVLAVYGDSDDSSELVYAVQGKACQEDSTCLGVEIFVIFDGIFTALNANTINQRWSAIKATANDEGSLYLTRYLILDDGQTIGNIRTNVLTTLAIAEQIQAEETAKIEDAEQAEASTVAATPAERVPASSIDFGEDAGDYANDGACDDARFESDGDDWTYQRNHVLQDATDCRTLYEAGDLTLYLDFGDNSGEYANDDTCDDNRFTGEGRSILETDSHVKRDAVDCIVAYRAGTINRP